MTTEPTPGSSIEGPTYESLGSLTGEPSRRRIRELLQDEGPLSVGVIARMLDLSIQSVRHHVASLVNQGIAEREGDREVRLVVASDEPAEKRIPDPEDPDYAPQSASVLSQLEHLFRPRSTVLVMEEGSAGLELLTKEFVGLEGEARLFAVNESKRDATKQLEHLGVEDCTVVDVVSDHFDFLQVNMDSTDDIVRTGGFVPDVFAEMGRELSALDEGSRGALDSLDFFFEFFDEVQVVRGVRTLSLATRRSGSTLFIGMRAETASPRGRALLENIADVVIVLQEKSRDPRPEWEMHVRKVRNDPGKLHSIAYRPGRGGRLILVSPGRVRAYNR